MGCQRDCSRYRWTKVTAIAPSPTADATRFTELCRTSPAANDPGTLVSRKKGWRSSVQHAGGRPSENKSEPVTRYPLGSRMMAVSLAQSVFGAPPMQTKSHAESTHAAVPVLIGMKLKPIELDDTTREKVANEVSLARSLEPEKAHASRARYRRVVGCAMFWHGDLLIVDEFGDLWWTRRVIKDDYRVVRACWPEEAATLQADIRAAFERIWAEAGTL